MTDRLPLRPLRAFVLTALLATAAVAAGPTTAHAQAETNCTERIEQARTLYETRRYAETIDALSTCFWRTDLPLAYVEQAYRLLALAYLRMDDVNSAKLAVVELLGRSPEYAPDPVQDLPSYVSLVELVRRQLRVEAPAALAAPADTAAAPDTSAAFAVRPDTSWPADLRPAPRRPLSLALYGGANNYFGERSPDGGGLTEGLGGGFGAEVGYALSPYVELGLYYLAGRYPSLLDPGEASLRTIDRSASSDWLHMGGLLARVRLLPARRASPFVQLGLNTTLSLLNDAIHVGLGPRLGAGVDVRVLPRLSAFVTAEGLFVVPDTATDLATTSESISDVYAFTTLGLRVQL